MRVRSCAMPSSPSIGIADDRARRLEPGSRRAQGVEFLPDRAETREVRVGTVRGRAFALRDDLLDRPLRRREVVDPEQAGQAELLGADLRLAVADEHAVLAKLGGEVREPVQRPVVQVALARVVLRRGRQQVRARDPTVVVRMAEAGAVRDLEALRPLDEHEVIERGLAERHQGHQDVGRKVPGAHRERGTPQVRRGPDRGEQVVHHRQVQHFFQRDLTQRAAPAFDRRQFGRRHALARVALQRPLRVQVRAHHRVLELRGLAQQVDEFFAILYDDLFGHGDSRSVQVARVPLPCGDGKRGGTGAPEGGPRPVPPTRPGRPTGRPLRAAPLNAGKWPGPKRPGIVPLFTPFDTPHHAPH